MSNIYDGWASESEIKDFIGRDIVTAYAKNADNPREIGYEFWSDIRHPETGETLKAVKGYCDSRDYGKCYYAEYRGGSGRSYYYLDARECAKPEIRGTKSISQQQYEDRLELQERQNARKERAAGTGESIYGGSGKTNANADGDNNGDNSGNNNGNNNYNTRF